MSAKPKGPGVHVILNLGAKAAEQKAANKPPLGEPDGDEAGGAPCPHCGVPQLAPQLTQMAKPPKLPKI